MKLTGVALLSLFLSISASARRLEFSHTEYGFGTGHVTGAPALADVNGDDRLDILIVQSSLADPNISVVRVMLGDGAGNFGDPVDFAIGPNPFAVVAADLNHDGAPELVMPFAVGDRRHQWRLQRRRPAGPHRRQRFRLTYTALMGRGDGTFDVVATNNANGYPEGAIAGDFNSDGHLDFAVGNSIDGVVSIFAGHGDGTFDSGLSFPAGNNAYMLAAGDIDRDSDLDLVVANAGALTVLRNDSPALKRRAVKAH